MLTEREQLIVDWLRRATTTSADGRQWPWDSEMRSYAGSFADWIEAGAHLKRPEPTIPVSEWVNVPSVGYGEKG